MHALDHVGFSPSLLTQIDSWCLTQLRHIFQEPVHLDHVNHFDFLQKHGLKDPLLIFRHRVLRAIQREELRHRRLDENDILLDHNLARPHEALKAIDSLLASRRLKEYTPQLTFFNCIYCSSSFASSGLLRKHYTTSHGLREGQIRCFDPLLDHKDGTPTCRRCLVPFTRWNNLVKHVEMTCLLELPQDMPDISDFKVAQRSFLRYAHNNLENLELQTDLLQKFNTRCALCNQFHNSLKLMKHHWRTQHPLVFESQDENYIRLMESSSKRPGTSSCAYCGKTTKGAHECLPLRNLAMLLTQTDQADPDVEITDIVDTPDRLLKCDFCSKHFTTAGGLQLHVAKQHPEVSVPVFQIERDCITNSTACAHCGRIFDSISAVERHINLKLCKEFDQTLAPTTMMTAFPELKDLITIDDCRGVLENSHFRQLLSTQCAVCLQEFRFKGNLSHHIRTRRAKYEVLASQEAIHLQSVFCTAAHPCYCGAEPASKVPRSHRCIVFLQFAIMKHYLGVSNFIPTQSTSPDGLVSTEQRLDVDLELANSEWTGIDMDDDSPDDATLAQLLKRTVRPFDVLSTSIDTVGECPKNGALDIFAQDSIFHGLPTFDKQLNYGDVIQFALHPSFFEACPLAIRSIAKGLYHEIWSSPAVLDQMCRRCVLCNHPLERDAVESHLADHWASITCVLNEFSSFKLCIQLLCDLFTVGPDGCGSRCPNASIVAQHFAQRRVAPSLQLDWEKASFERTVGYSSKETGWSSATCKRRRFGPASLGDFDGQIAFAPRGHSPYPPSGARVCSSSQGWYWKSDTSYDEAECGMASIFGEVSESSALLSQPLVQDVVGKSHVPLDSQEWRRSFPAWTEPEPDYHRGEVPLSDVVPSVSQVDIEQGPTLGEVGIATDSSKVSGTERVQGQHPALSCSEESSRGQCSQGRLFLSLASHHLDTNVSSPAAIVLSQRLATRSCRLEETITEPFSSCQANRQQDIPKTLRVCLNPEGLFCWLNATCLGLCWLGLVCGCSTDDWRLPWLFHELTRFSPQPLTLRFGDSTFHQMLREWAEHHLLGRQQDVADFLAYCLPCLMPDFYSAEWLPQWAFRDGSVLEDHQEKGARFAPLMFHVTDPNFDSNLQSLVNHWHDETGHVRLLRGRPPGTCIHLNRLVGDIDPTKDCRPIDIPSHVALPCFVDELLQWHGYTVIGVSYHLGSSFSAGHWRTVIWQGVPWNRWLNYDDGALPDVLMHLSDCILKNWCVVWLAADPRFD